MTSCAKAWWCVLIAVVLFLAVIVYQGFSMATRAEFALCSMLLACEAVDKYVETYKKWPESWEALETVSFEGDGPYSWPKDADMVREYVAIDFDLTLGEVLEQAEPNKFRAIRPKVPSYPNYKVSISNLLATVEKVDREKEH